MIVLSHAGIFLISKDFQISVSFYLTANFIADLMAKRMVDLIVGLIADLIVSLIADRNLIK